jgi:hypothetical protein
MRIVQSFWSSNRDLTKNRFGWLSPQFHLMAWTLSCLKLKEYYDDIHLYTDSNTKAILIDYLKLPYKMVHTDYDHINHYRDSLYALPKIMTYAAQDEPFIHVDGDIFIWDKFSHSLENAGLVAQNFEIGTWFTASIIKGIKDHIVYSPDYLQSELTKEKPSAYNAGIIGGSDLAFLKEYANKALEIVDKNCDSIYKNETPGNFNVIFEQTLFHALSARENKTVSRFYPGTYEDHGYTIGEFCDFTEVPYRLKYLHLIGAHKRNPYVCDLMGRTLFKEYPEYFYKIIALFNEEHIHYNKKIKDFLSHPFTDNISENNESQVSDDFMYRRTCRLISEENNTDIQPFNEINKSISSCQSPTIKEIFQFENQVKAIVSGWSDIPGEELKATELAALGNFEFFFKPAEHQMATVLERNAKLKIIEDSFDWTPEVKRIIMSGLPDNSIDNFGIALIPQLFFKGYKEVTIDLIDYNILAILSEPMPLKEILPWLSDCFAIKEHDNEDNAIYDLTLLKLKNLFINKCIFIKNGVGSLN